MSLRNAAFFALIGMVLLTALVTADFIRLALAFFRDIVAAVVLIRAIIYLAAAVGVTVFFYVFVRLHPR